MMVHCWQIHCPTRPQPALPPAVPPLPLLLQRMNYGDKAREQGMGVGAMMGL